LIQNCNRLKAGSKYLVALRRYTHTFYTVSPINNTKHELHELVLRSVNSKTRLCST
jgi:hypothetical protein